MPYFVDFSIALVAGILASIIFLYYVLRRWRPKIEISPFIAHCPDPADNAKRIYCFKFINKSKHPAYDVQIRICELKRIPVHDGKIHERRIDVRAKKDFLAHIPKFRSNKEIVTSAPHAIVFSCLDDIEPILKDDTKCIEIQIILKHGLTGLSQVFKHEYSDMTDVRKGNFLFGNNLTVG